MNNPPADMPSGPQTPYQSPYPQSYPATVPSPPPVDGAAAAPEQKSRRRGLLIGAIVAVVVIALLVVVALVGGLSDFLGLGIMFVPLIVLAMLAYAGKKNVTAKVFAYIALAMTGLGMIFYSLIALLIGYVADWDKFDALAGGGVPSAQEMQGIFAPSAGAGLLLATVLYLVAVIVAASMLLRPVRVLVSRVIPIDPDNFVHKIALSLLVLVFLSSLIPLLVLGGTPPLLNLVTGSGSEAGNGGGPNVGGQSITVSQLSPLYQLIWTIPAVFIMAGWPIERKFPDMLKRLGLVRPTLMQVLFGIGFGFVLAALGVFVIDPAITWVWQAFGWPTTNAGAFDQLLGNLITPVGAVIVGVAAGLGEEMGARGLLQPRIGLIASNLVFTASHGFQYGADALLSVFIIGLILGVVRARANTSTSAIVHGMFDFTQLLASALIPGS